MRWTSKRKEEILEALKEGSLTPGEVEALYGIGLEELDEWRRRYALGGRVALRVRSLYAYRERSQSPKCLARKKRRSARRE